MRRKRVPVFCVLAIAALTGAMLMPRAARDRSMNMIARTLHKHTVDSRMTQFGDNVRRRLEKDFARVGVPYPPQRMTLLALKQERVLEVWVGPPRIQRLKTYAIIAASGRLGPKLCEGDRQVPEGLYRIESLNPNSAFHLSLRLNYPNEQDREAAQQEGRTDLGSDIMIHGSNASIGCLAMGDEAAEELFVLAAETGLDHVTVIISPVDLRMKELPGELRNGPQWMLSRYEAMQREMKSQLNDPEH